MGTSTSTDRRHGDLIPANPGTPCHGVYAPRMARPNVEPTPPRLPTELPSHADFRLAENADLYRLTVQGDFTDANLPEMTVEESRLLHSAFVGADLGRLRLVDVVVEGSDFSGADLQEASFTRVAFSSCRMSGALFGRAHLQDVTFSDSKLDGVSLRMCEGDRVVFDHVNLRGSDLYAAHLTSARFFDCDLYGTDVSQAVLPRARFHGSLLSDIKGGEYLRDIVIESSQVLPLATRVFSALGIGVDDEREAPNS
jgi:uncharacterized protein YjbI with pentapeptide repeats